MAVILTGIKATNQLTLGNYLGVMQKLVELQNNATNQLYVFVADLHSITTPFDPVSLQANCQALLFSYAAIGLDFEKTKIFFQAPCYAHSQLAYLLACHAYMGELNRMTQFKDKSLQLKRQNQTVNIPVGLFYYPLLMAADILLYEPDFVLVGQDQTQHLELTKLLANRINKKYGQPLFKVPQQLTVISTQKIMDLQNPLIKMSKSNPHPKGAIYLFDQPLVATQKIMQAKTDGFNQLQDDPSNQPGISNLLKIYAALSGLSKQAIIAKHADDNYGGFKKALALLVNNFLTNFQTNYRQMEQNANQLMAQVTYHTKQVQNQAVAKLNQIHTAMGLKPQT